MISFLHNFQPNAIMYSFGPIDIHWYGFLIFIGSLLAILTTIKLAKYYGIEKDAILDLAFWLILGGIVGARIYHIFLELPYYLENPLNIFKVWQGGLAIHGAIIAGIIIIYFFSKKEKINFWLITSLIVPGLALAQAIGRWGNYFNQELFGLPTNLLWGIPIELFNRPLEYLSYEYFHPTFLYESIGNFLIFLILIGIHVWIIRTEKRTQNNSIDCHALRVMRYALCAMCYAFLYSTLRFSTEFIRIDKTPEILGLRWPQIVSLLIIAVSLIVVLKKTKIHANINS